MTENTKNKKAPGKKPKTPSRTSAKAREKKMREERMKGTLLFGLKLVIVLALVAGAVHAFPYAKGIYKNNQSRELPANADGSFLPESTLPDDIENSQPQTALSSDETSPSKPSSKPETEKASSKASKAETTSEPSSAETVAVKVDALDPNAPAPVLDTPVPPQAQIAPEAPTAPEAQNIAPQAETAENTVQPPELHSILSPGTVDSSKPMIAFTFDDGPYTKVDKRILDVLESNGGRATFFIVGSRVDDYKETLTRIYTTGSEIGNHTYNHKNLEKLPPEEVLAQIEMTNDAVEAVTGYRPKLVRVPYGAYQGEVAELVNYPIIQWNVDTEDWKNKDKTSALASILSHAKDGNIILMHDLYPSTAEAFEEAVPQLIAQGFQLVTVSEMYAAKGIGMEPGKVYFNIR